MGHTYVQLPPDSTGKRVGTHLELIVYYEGGTIDFAVGDTVVGLSSGFTGVVMFVYGTTASGHLHVRLPRTVDMLVTPTAGEPLQVDGVTNATVSATIASVQVQHQTSVIVGRDVTHPWDIDSYGAGKIAFTEGDPQLDAFGKLRISQETTLGEYISTYDNLSDEFYDSTGGSGTITHEANSGAILFSVGTDANAYVKRISHLYHRYQAGVSQHILFTAAAGDAGKTNLRRMMGYGDDSDGVFFKMDDLAFSLVIRNSTSGSIVETIIPQADFNEDTMDGSGSVNNPTGVALDFTKDNIYWIDFQWLGAGRVRFGTFIQGRRVIMHSENHSNEIVRPYMRSGSLPIYFLQENYGGATASSSEMRIWCATVKSDSPFEPPLRNFSIHPQPSENVDNRSDKKNIFGAPPGRTFFAVRARSTVNGIENRFIGMPKTMSISNEGAYPIVIEAHQNVTLTGGSWINIADSSGFEYNAQCEAVVAEPVSDLVGTWVIGPNSFENIDLTNVFNYREHRIMLAAGGTGSPPDLQQLFLHAFNVHSTAPLFIATGSFSFVNSGGSPYTGSPSGGDSITRSSGSFVDDGLQIGHGIKVDGSVNNDGYYIVTNVTPTTLYLQSYIVGQDAGLTPEGPVSCTITGSVLNKVYLNMNFDEIR